MNSRLLRLALIVAAFCVVRAARGADNELSDQEKKDGWVLLYDGKTWDGWSGGGPEKKLKPANILPDGTFNTLKVGGYCAFYDKQKFGDFVLSVDFKMSPKCNSGIFIRVADLKNPVQTGFEIQVLDSGEKTTPQNKNDCMSLYDCLAPSKNACKKAGEWQHAEITFQGNKLQVVLNEEKVIETDLDKWTEAGKNPDGSKNKFKTALKDYAKEGYIGFQDHGHECWYKNVKVKPLK